MLGNGRLVAWLGSVSRSGAWYGSLPGCLRLCPPIIFELFLHVSVLEPEVAHIHGFGSALFDGAIFDTDADDGAAVASAMRSRGLVMAHFMEGVLAVVEHSTGFGFGSGGDDNFKDCAVGMKGAIVGRIRIGS